MVGFKTEGIILKRSNLGEADRILTVFTLHRGKLTVLAKGVRRITSRRAGNVELLNRVSMFLHPGKNFFILTEAEAIDAFPKIKEDLTLSTYAYHILELVDKLTAENQENPALYKNLTEILNRLTINPRQVFVRAFEIKSLSLLGFISFQSDGVKLYHPWGVISSRIGNLLGNLEKMGWDEIEKIQMDEKEAMELENILRYYLERTIEGKLKSRLFLRKIKNE